MIFYAAAVNLPSVFSLCCYVFTAKALEHSFSCVVKPQVHFSLSPTQWVISVDCLLLATEHSTNARQVHYRLPFSVVLERNLDLVRAVKKVLKYLWKM